jgi:energy-coupling factor transporter ATP-binding protein EcfA2
VNLTDINSLEPYPGLRSFRKDESDIFFGRDDHVEEMIAKLAQHHFLCITGASGCGKSSLARTGLMNHLEAGFLPGRSSDWIFCDLRPGNDPIKRLFAGLAKAIVEQVDSAGENITSEREAEIYQLFHSNSATYMPCLDPLSIAIFATFATFATFVSRDNQGDEQPYRLRRSMPRLRPRC